MRKFVLRLFERPGGRGTPAPKFAELPIKAKNTNDAVKMAVAMAETGNLPSNIYSADLFGDRSEYPLLHMDLADEPDASEP